MRQRTKRIAARLPQVSKPPLLQRLWRRLVHPWWVLVLDLAGVASLVVLVLQQWSEMKPDIHPRGATNGASFELPFIVRNKSSWINMRITMLVCRIDLLYVREAAHGKTILLRNTSLIRDDPIAIKAGRQDAYDCDPSRLIRIADDGSIMVKAGGEWLSSRPSAARGPLSVVKTCMWISGRFQLIGDITVPFISDLFQWPASLHNQQWVEGKTIEALQKQEEPIPFEQPMAAYGGAPVSSECTSLPELPSFMDFR